jgi:hypothetical protein
MDKNSTIKQIIVGLHVSWRSWRIYFSTWRPSDGVPGVVGQDPNNDFGTIASEWNTQ